MKHMAGYTLLEMVIVLAVMALATAMVAQSSTFCVLADDSKIGIRGRYAVAASPETQTLVTNASASNTAALAALRAQGVQVVEV